MWIASMRLVLTVSRKCQTNSRALRVNCLIYSIKTFNYNYFNHVQFLDSLLIEILESKGIAV